MTHFFIIIELRYSHAFWMVGIVHPRHSIPNLRGSSGSRLRDQLINSLVSSFSSISNQAMGANTPVWRRDFHLGTVAVQWVFAGIGTGTIWSAVCCCPISRKQSPFQLAILFWQSLLGRVSTLVTSIDLEGIPVSPAFPPNAKLVCRMRCNIDIIIDIKGGN